MNTKNVSFPYPVLGISDDVFPLLEDDCVRMDSPVKTSSDYVFRIHLSHRNETIEQLVRSGSAEYVCEVSCPETFLRRCVASCTPDMEITLSRREVNGRINFNSYIAVRKPIKGYTNPDFNDDYYGFAFDLERGDVLAVFPLAYYNTNIKYDRLFAAGSFMKIVEADHEIEKTYFDLDNDYILIVMPHVLFEEYRRVGNSFPELIHSSIVHNALVYALLNLSDYQERGRLWADSIVQRIQSEKSLQQYDLDIPTDVFNMADDLLKDPYRRMLDGLKRIADKFNTNDDTED